MWQLPDFLRCSLTPSTQGKTAAFNERGLLLLAEAVARAHRQRRNCWVHVYVDSLTQAHTRATRSKSRVAALTSANTRPKMSISFCCGTSLWSLHWIPKEDALRSLRCAFSFFPTRGKCERKGREVKQTNKLLSVDHSGRELKGVPDAALSCDDPHSVHLFLPLNLCPDHPSCKTALPRAQYHAFSLL